MNEKVKIISKLSVNHGVKILCRVLKLSRSTYYDNLNRKPSRRTVENEKLKQEIVALYEKSKRRYGCIKIRHELKTLGYNVSQNRVLRLMKQIGIQSIICKRYRKHSRTTDTAERINLLKRQFYADKPNQIWLSDITYIRTHRDGWTYLACVLDMCTRKIVGYSYGRKMTAQLVTDAVTKAFRNQNYPNSVTIHSDQGSQYISESYLNLSRKLRFRVSYSAKGCPFDNAPMEAFNAILKKEEVYLSVYHDFDSAKVKLFAYIEGFYNRNRIHGSIDFMSPVAFELLALNS